jgi:hypothetical protein
MQSDFIPKVISFQSAVDTVVAHLVAVEPGANLTMTERGDGLWNVKVNGIDIHLAIGPERLNQIAGKTLVEV